MVQIEEHVEAPPDAQKLKTPSDPQEAYDVVVNAVVESTGGDQETALQLKKSLEAMYNKPPHKTVSKVVGQELGIEDMRRLLFAPTPSDMAVYCRVIRGASELQQKVQAGEEQPTAGKAATPFLSLLYLYHSHVPEAAHGFVGVGGLLSLAHLVNAPNLYIRGQALEVFQNLTNTIDWFADIDEADPLPMLSVHRQMLGLMQTPFLPNLLSNVEIEVGNDSGSLPFTSLRIAAFWLSWIRFTFCKNGTMHLSQSILQRLETFTTKKGAAQEELELAGKVFTDFSSFEQAPSEGPWGSGITVHVDCCTAAREKGNSAFKTGRCMCACMWYSVGIDLDPSDSACYANRAAALLKFSPNYEGDELKNALGRVLNDCNTALELKPESVARAILQ